ncbi:hypothetical protein PIB30_099100, partial [Stylosanthes scabra]|nr:hypothetical protein [Stylosanthes scabra]
HLPVVWTLLLFLFLPPTGPTWSPSTAFKPERVIVVGGSKNGPSRKRRLSSSPVTAKTLRRYCLCCVAIRHVRTRVSSLSSLTQRDAQRSSRETVAAMCLWFRRP